MFIPKHKKSIKKAIILKSAVCGGGGEYVWDEADGMGLFGWQTKLFLTWEFALKQFIKVQYFLGVASYICNLKNKSHF